MKVKYILFYYQSILAQTDVDKIDSRSQWERKIQNQEMKDSGWRSDETNSMTKSFYGTSEFI